MDHKAIEKYNTVQSLSSLIFSISTYWHNGKVLCMYVCVSVFYIFTLSLFTWHTLLQKSQTHANSHCSHYKSQIHSNSTVTSTTTVTRFH